MQKSKTCNRGRVAHCRSPRRADVQRWTRRTRVALTTPCLYRRLLPLSLSLSLAYATPPLSRPIIFSKAKNPLPLPLLCRRDGQGECQSHRPRRRRLQARRLPLRRRPLNGRHRRPLNGHRRLLRRCIGGCCRRSRSDPAGMGPLRAGAVRPAPEPLRHLHRGPMERGNYGLLPFLFPIPF